MEGQQRIKEMYNSLHIKLFCMHRLKCTFCALALVLEQLPPKPVFRRADIRAPEESSGWIFRDVTDESGRISLPIGRNREESGDGRSGRTGPRPPPLSSLFQPMGREMRPRRHGKSIRRTPPEGGYPPDFRRISAGYPPGIRRISAGYPPSGKRVLGPASEE